MLLRRLMINFRSYEDHSCLLCIYFVVLFHDVFSSFEYIASTDGVKWEGSESGRTTRRSSGETEDTHIYTVYIHAPRGTRPQWSAVTTRSYPY
jgi:hypothetical protein